MNKDRNKAEKLDKAQMTTIALIDRIRMLDNDLIRLRSKLNTVLEMRENEKRKSTEDNKRRDTDRISKSD